MFGKNNHQGPHKKEGPFTQMIRQAAFWIAVLLTFLTWPQWWQVSGWLAQSVFSAQVADYEMLFYMRIALFAILIMIALSLARAGIGSAAVMATIMLISKLPMF